MPEANRRGRKAMTMTRSPSHQRQGAKKFPPQIKMVNMIYATQIPKRERMRTLRDDNAMEPVAPKYNLWSSDPITFDRMDCSTNAS